MLEKSKAVRKKKMYPLTAETSLRFSTRPQYYHKLVWHSQPGHFCSSVGYNQSHLLQVNLLWDQIKSDKARPLMILSKHRQNKGTVQPTKYQTSPSLDKWMTVSSFPNHRIVPFSKSIQPRANPWFLRPTSKSHNQNPHYDIGFS